MSDIRCPSCGASHAADDAFCPRCGARGPDAPSIPVRQPVDTTAERQALFAELQQALAPRIQLVKELASGGMGTVFLGRDPALKRAVVIKVLSPELARDASARSRFAREAESTAAVSHPNVVSVFQVGELPASGTNYFVMQYVDGQTLAEAFPVGTVVPVARSRQIVGAVASALAAAHARGVVHRDIKPANIMVERESDRVVVLDFGISAAISPERRAELGTKLTQAGTSIGTPQYMSPEQAVGEPVTGRSDVYNLGLIAFELLTGRPAFEAQTPMALAAAHINQPAPPVETVRPDVDPAFAGMVDGCLRKDPAARPSAEQVMRSLGVQVQQVIEWPPPGLEGLHRLGARFATALCLSVAVGMPFFILLFAPPTWGSPAWAEGERSGLWFLMGGGCCGGSHLSDPRWDPTPIWLALLSLLIVAEAGVGAFVLAQAWRLGSLLVRARRSGYPLGVCLDVAFDARPDTAAVVNGTGPYAALEPEVRKRLRRWRRWRSGTVTAAPVLAILAVVVGLLVGAGGSVPAEGLVTRAALGLMLAPLLAEVVIVTVLAVQESTLVGRRTLTLRQSLARWRQSLVMRDVVATWLRTAGAQERPGPAGRAAALVVGGYLGVALAIAGFLGAMILVAGVTLRTSATVMSGREGTREWQGRRIKWRGSVTWVRVDSAARSLFPASDLRAIPDTDGVVGLVDVLTAGLQPGLRRAWRGSGRGGMTIPGYPAEIYRWKGAASIEPEFLFHLLLVQRADVPEGIRGTARQNLASPGYAAWKQFARAAPLPYWYYATEFGGATSPLMVAPLHWSPSQSASLIQTSLFEALFAAKRGDRLAARAAAAELVAIGSTLAREPTVNAQRIGVQTLLSGLVAVREMARDGLLPDLATRVRGAIQLLREWPDAFESFDHELSPAAILLTADPGSPTTQEALAGRNPSWSGAPVGVLEPLDRWSLIEAVVPAFCTSAREVLLGIDPRRGELLQAAIGKQADVPRTDEWIRLNLRWFQQWRDDPAAGGERWDGTRPPVPALAKPLGWIGLRGLRDRIAFCSKEVWR